LKDVVRERPDDVEILQALAEGYAQTHRWAEAERCYTHWLEVQPDRLETYLARGQLRLAAASFQQARNTDAADDFREVLRREPNHFEGRLYLAHSMLADAHVDEARTELLVCKQLDPRRLEPYVGLAACALEARAWDEAQGYLNEALVLDPKSAYVLSMQGDLYLRGDHFDQAVTIFRQVLALDQRNKAARLKLAQALSGTGQADKAEEQMRIYRQLQDETNRSPKQ
jgi:tetratricopeptide (TPR) repeat protein